MKIHGKSLSGPNIEVVVFPRPSGDVVFKAQAVLEYEEFTKLNPQPEPPKVMRRGGAVSADVTDKKYVEAHNAWAESRTHYMILKSLEATEGLEWETVVMADPETWPLYQQELTDAGFTAPDIARIVNCVVDACGLNQKKIDEATARFLAGQGQEQESGSSPSIAQKSTQSGEPVNASA